MTDITLFQAYESVQSDKPTQRSEGLRDLRHILSIAENVKDINDKGFHKMFEALFKAAITDKSGMLKQTRASFRPKFEDRLQQCASTLRMAIEISVKVLKYKTVKAIFQHIMQTLPLQGDSFCEPLALDYIKSLRIILSHEPHAEHLMPEDWLDLIKFCCGGLEHQMRSISDPENNSSSNANGSSLHLSGMHSFRTTISSSQPNTRLKLETTEMVYCIEYLVSAPQAYVAGEKTSKLLVDSLLSFLSKQQSESIAHQPAFTALNVTLESVSANNLKLASRISSTVLPLICKLWTTKHANLKDQLLICLIFCFAHFVSDLKRGDSSIRHQLEEMLEILCSEYQDRLERDRLQIDHLFLKSAYTVAASPATPFNLQSFSLRSSSQKAEQYWTILQYIAVLIHALDSTNDEPSPMDIDESGGPSKRRKISSHFDNLVSELKSPQMKHRLAALQVMPFYLDKWKGAASDVTAVLFDLVQICSEDNAEIACWAMLSMVAILYNPQFESQPHTAIWQQLWQLAIRTVPSASMCRVSTYLLQIMMDKNCVNQPEHIQLIDDLLLKTELNGPAIVTDSTIAFWAAILKKRRSTVHLSVIEPEERLWQWILSKWRPMDMFDRTSLAQPDNLDPSDILHCLFLCSARKYPLTNPHRDGCCGTIGQALLRANKASAIVAYLLLDDERLICGDLERHSIIHPDEMLDDSAALRKDIHVTIDKQIVDFLERQSDALTERWQSITNTQIQLISSDMIHEFTIFIAVASIFRSCTMITNTKRAEIFDEKVLKLAEILGPILGKVNYKREHLDAFASTIFNVLPQIRDLLHNDVQMQLFQGLSGQMFCSLDRSLQRHLPMGEAAQDEMDDVMELDDMFQERRKKDQASDSEVSRTAQKVACSVQSRTIFALEILRFVSLWHTEGEEAVYSEFAEFLTALQPSQLISSRRVINDVIRDNQFLSRDIAETLVTEIAGELLRKYDVERCEAGIVICLDLVTVLVDEWVHQQQNDELYDRCEAVYTWIILAALGKKVMSSSVRISVAELLRRVLAIKPDYRPGGSSSVRTHFFELQDDEDIRVRYFVANRMLTLFNRFPIERHAKIYNDVMEYISKNADHVEGMALRVYSLAQLVPASFHLMKSAIFHIFETAALVPNSSPYAERVMPLIAKSINFRDPKELLQKFKSQLLYVWFDHEGDMNDIPYQLFGYSSRRGLFMDVREELVAILILSRKEKSAEELSAILEIDYKELLRSTFARIYAYSLAQASVTKSGERDSGERHLRQHLGDEEFFELLAEQLSLIISILFEVLNTAPPFKTEKSDRSQNDGEGDPITKFLSQHNELSDTRNIMNEILEISHPSAKILEPFRPFYKPGSIFTCIHHVCQKTGLGVNIGGGLGTVARIWDPALYTLVMRHLFETITPSLGSDQVCAIVRKIRVLVSLAGHTSTQGYPLEMTIHGLVPYLFDEVCAKDTIGVIQYLLRVGKSYLIKVPSFVVSTSLAVLTGLQTFISKEPSGEDIHSQLEHSQTTAQEFQEWLAEYLRGYESTQLNSRQSESFHAIINSAVDIRAGNVADEANFSLLKALIRDEMSNEPLLDDVSKRLAFTILGSSFRRPRNGMASFIASDREAVAVSKVLLKVCKKFDLSDEFLLWAARVLGRSFASNGVVQEEWNEEVVLSEPLRMEPSKKAADGATSQKFILRAIQGLLSGSDKHEVGLAERTLREIIHADQGPDMQGNFPAPLYDALRWMSMQAPPVSKKSNPTTSFGDIPELSSNPQFEGWVRKVANWMSGQVENDAVVTPLSDILSSVNGLARQVIPYLLHLLLLRGASNGDGRFREECSAFFKKCFANCSEATTEHTIILINCVLYLRTKAYPKESTSLAREEWLDIDYHNLAQVATTCKLYKTALLFAEMHVSRSNKEDFEPSDVLLEIYRNVNEPDSFYGVKQNASLRTVMSRLKYEGDGWKSLSFEGAHLDSATRETSNTADVSINGVLDSLVSVGLSGLSLSLVRNAPNSGDDVLDSMLQSALRLEQWDLPCPSNNTSQSASIYQALQFMNNNPNVQLTTHNMDKSVMATMEQMIASKQTGESLATGMRTLAILFEIEEVTGAANVDALKKVFDNRQRQRDRWMETGNFADVEKLHAARIATFSSLVKRAHLRERLQLDVSDARLLEAEALISACQMSRVHDVLQKSLALATDLSEAIDPCRSVGIEIEVAAKFEASNVLWEQGEMVSSIGSLHALLDSSQMQALAKQSIQVSRAELFAKVGTWTSEARLEKPEYIVTTYLEPAVNELKKQKLTPKVIGKVHHDFAVFCDQQLRNPGNKEDLDRAEKLMLQKQAEAEQLERLVRSTSGAKANSYRSYRNKAKVLFEQDRFEFERLRENKQLFLARSIEHYLLCLQSCDDFESDALKFCSLWLEHSTNERANVAAYPLLKKVPSRKFVPMMNQLSSRLSVQNPQDGIDRFQELLYGLIYRICKEHPYHGLYQIMALQRQTRKDSRDVAAISRQQAAEQILETLGSDEETRTISDNLFKATGYFMELAQEKVEKRQSQVAFKKLFPRYWRIFDKEIPELKVPPPTMKIEIRADCNYSKTPHILRFDPDIGLASGISMPKIITCRSSAGQRFKQLVKGGNDDLRQDAIMEQVFEQVSDLLQKSRATRQRNLSIRTYKVLPLSTTSGIIEFVLHTMPLHDYLIPAHALYHPKDWKPGVCREEITKVQQKSREDRIRVFERVMENFQPVMRYFFLHSFHGPDDWFSKRLAYSRSTAAISILGHILGLGDRHGHNILLDQNSGEVVHIDLGVAFEQGRVLPVPEVVPFRLTRDIIDGMGITKTEGVFRRCCEFTLTVLRNEASNIMTILDVLRYDPLYSWTISPLRLRKIQDQDENSAMRNEARGANQANSSTNESEADRALTVVLKKLSKTLSVQATVNELIQSASDTKNLAVLYSGWAAYV